MIVYINTSSPEYELYVEDNGTTSEFRWQAGRELAKGILKFTEESLQSIGKTWTDISAIGVFKGPGSYTGLRIGLSVWNTVADTYNIPIVGVTGEDWIDQAKTRLQSGDNDQLVMPEYGGEANITKPRK